MNKLAFSHPLLYSASQTQEFDRIACLADTPEKIESLGFQLMQQAGRTAFQTIQQRYLQNSTVLEEGIESLCVLAGRGNNGGDGYIVAALAKQDGMQVTVLEVGDLTANTNSTELARAQAIDSGVECIPFSPDIELEAGLFVDALLGTGLSVADQQHPITEIKQPMASAIEWLNAAKLDQQSPVFAIDVPSGLCADTGRVFGQAAVLADCTITFIAMKKGLLTLDGPDYCGGYQNIIFAPLLIERDGTLASSEIYQQQTPEAELLNLYQLQQTQQLMPKRAGNSHKGSHGRLLVVAGDHGYAGAAVMASEAAMMSGAGLVACATRPENCSVILTRRPEVMARGIDSGLELESWITDYQPQVMMIGPGLGKGSWADLMMQQAMEYQRLHVDNSEAGYLIIDADGLNLLAQDNWQTMWSSLQQELGTQSPAMSVKTLITPHPAEAARLLKCSVSEVQRDRFASAQSLADKMNSIVVLKGQGSIIATPISMAASANALPKVVSDGNASMAVGGMGDILAGVSASLLAQLINQDQASVSKNSAVQRAAHIAVCCHGASADVAVAELVAGAKVGDAVRGLQATELLPYLRDLLNR